MRRKPDGWDMTSRSDEIYTLIYNDILDCVLKPGQRLHIQELAEKYGATLSPVREALSKLTATELVVAIAQKGFRVAEISLDDLYDIYRTRVAIEQIALKLSIEQGDDSWEAELLKAYHRLEQFEKKSKMDTMSEYEEWEKRHKAFTLALMSGCNLSHLLRIHEKIYTQTERYRRMWIKAALATQKHLAFAAKQKPIMQAALARDTQSAQDFLSRHFEKATTLIARYLS